MTLPGDRPRADSYPEVDMHNPGLGVLEYELLRDQWEALHRSPGRVADDLTA